MMRRFVEFNGGVSAEQLSWLDSVLQESDESHEVVLIAGLFLLDWWRCGGVVMAGIGLMNHDQKVMSQRCHK